MTLGERISTKRVEIGLMQNELAEKSGTTTASISRYENDLRVPNIFAAKRIASALGIKLDDLVSPEVMSEENKLAFVKGLGELLHKYSREKVESMEYTFDAETEMEFVNIKFTDSDVPYKANITHDSIIAILSDVYTALR